jgi:catechol 2,3-dioxygenase-like lactoylglutathione lyase family enzyme
MAGSTFKNGFLAPRLEDQERSMIELSLLLSPAVLLPIGALCARLAAANETGVSMGHLHLTVSDVEASKMFWLDLGAAPVSAGPLEGVTFPGSLILLSQGKPSGGTAGSVVNHVGFIVPNVEAAMAKCKAGGVKTEAGRNAQQGFLFTPDVLMKIEILEDSSLSVPIAFHHIHFFVPDPGPGNIDSVAEIKAWYANLFGAKPGKRGPFEADDLPGANLTFSKSDTPTAGTRGRVLDHIGFEVKHLEAFCKRAEAAAVKFDGPYTKLPEGVSRAYLTDPWGTYIELTEGLDLL